MGSHATNNFVWAALFLNILVGISNTQVQNTTSSPEVTILQGTLRGTTLLSRSNRSISAFRGIPYAQPPIGNLRFSAPVAAGTWNGTLNASVEGNSCPQLPYGSSTFAGDEDCLYLNVYSPQLPGSGDISLLPVMVWIPGGGFETGNGNSDLYGPGHLLDADVVLVALNYRLGPFGFLSTGDEVAPGNWGLKDQVLALRWVQENIANFGGDPNNVTIFGQSAAGASVQLLALSESTTGLFHKYISESGSAFGYWVYRPRALFAKVALQLGELLNCPTNTSALLVDCLRELNASEIINTRSQFYKWRTYPDVLWGPTDEPDIVGAFLTDSPANLIAAGKIRDLPSITGTVRDEAHSFVTGFLPGSDALEDLLNNFDEAIPIIFNYVDRVEDVSAYTAAIKTYYFNNDLTADRTQLWFSLGTLVSDVYFMYPVYSALRKQYALAENAPYFYSFEYRGTFSYSNQQIVSPLLNGSVAHCDELIYLFPEIEALFGASPENMSEADLRMVDTMVQLWTSFAINGTPTTTAAISNTTWVPYSSNDNYLRIGNNSDIALDVQYNFLQERMQFWEQLTATRSGNTAAISSSLPLIISFLSGYSMMYYLHLQSSLSE